MWYSDEPHTTRPSVAPAGDALIGASDQGETTEPAVTTCDWFQWCGGATCDNCGRNPGEHRGVEWLAKGASPFGSERDNVHVEWKDYGPGRSLNVPFLTSCMGNGQLEALQGISSAPAGDPQGGEE